MHAEIFMRIKNREDGAGSNAAWNHGACESGCNEYASGSRVHGAGNFNSIQFRNHFDISPPLWKIHDGRANGTMEYDINEGICISSGLFLFTI